MTAKYAVGVVIKMIERKTVNIIKYTICIFCKVYVLLIYNVRLGIGEGMILVGYSYIAKERNSAIFIVKSLLSR